MNRFASNVDRRRPGDGLVGLVGMVGVVAISFVMISRIGQEAGAKELENLQHALDRGAMTCYAIEGKYPDSLSYLKDNYGITWNEKQYLVDYEIVGSNLPPDITVIPLH